MSSSESTQLLAEGIKANGKPSKTSRAATAIIGALALASATLAVLGVDTSEKAVSRARGAQNLAAARPLEDVLEEANCAKKELAYYTLNGAGDTTFEKSGEDGKFTYFNMSLGPANLAKVVSVRASAGDSDVYSTIRTTKFFDEWRYGFIKDGMDFNPDTFVVPEDMIVDEQGMSAAVTVRFSEADGATTVFPAQFVALDRATPDVPGLYTMVVRVYADDATTAAQLQPSRGEGHTCYDAAAPHFHTLPHEKLDSVLGSSATDLIESEFFVVDVYLGCYVLSFGWKGCRDSDGW